MGRIKIVAVKSMGDEIIKEHGKNFSEDFDSNKKALGEIKDIKSKKIRNIVAGYISREMKKIKTSGI